MITDELRELMLSVAEIAVSKYIAMQSPTINEVTQSALYREFGRAWVEKQLRTGRKEFASCRRGNRKMYDRSAFVAQWAAERCPAEIIGKYALPHTIK